MSEKKLLIEGARQNNLKNINLSLPHNKVIAITGVSGSGTSSLAFDAVFAEGQWRFMESLSTYARLFLEKLDRPDVEAIHNIRPAIALEQKNPIRAHDRHYIFPFSRYRLIRWANSLRSSRRYIR
jgi:excinuclease ABC subunit A